MITVTNQAYKLLHQGAIALSQVEANGIRIDTDYLKKIIEEISQTIEKLVIKQKKDKIYKIWKRTFRQNLNMGSREQLGKVLFDVMKHPCTNRTKTGRPKTDEDALGGIDLKFVKRFLRIEQYKKAKSTYLQGILRETTDGVLHPFFNLHLVSTYRSSSSNPNFQNIPIRNPEISRLVRRAFIPRNNHHIVETDFGGIEVCGAACYHKDPIMISYIKNPKKDMHRDMAAQCYMLEKKQVTKDTRYCGKNKFVFPQFYGDFYIHCAPSLWNAIKEMKLKTKDGLYLKKHLKEQGIYKLGDCDVNSSPRNGTFEKHIKEVENDFWNNRFKIYNQWKIDWYNNYLKRGWIETLTGFRIEGEFKRNEIINYPVQGTAFHFLLWSLIRIQKILNKYKMKTKIVGQIHDSIVSDVYKKELKDYLEISQQIMTIDIIKYWKWINVPLTVKAEIAPLNKSWYEKTER